MIIEKVQYEIDWTKFKRGTSFFIPCLNVAQTKSTILKITRRLKFKVLMKVAIEEGIRGLRVWRI